ncbi:MAG: DUF1015 domain-containing protein [Jatrophihabitantaceae bacterium]
MTDPTVSGLVLRPFRAVRPAVDSARLAKLLCPPYDVITSEDRAELLEHDPDNAVAIVLPEPAGGRDKYSAAAARLDQGILNGLYAVDATPALYVYEMRGGDRTCTRGLLGAVELRDPADGVILPHENTMAGPVTDRLALMVSTQANVEPIYLVYDGGGAASQAVRDVDTQEPIAQTQTPDGITHRLWALTDPDSLGAIRQDLAARRALIADGHHRYATYRQLQEQRRLQSGPGPWDFGLTLLVDSTDYGPQVHAIHRVLVGLPLPVALEKLVAVAEFDDVRSAQDGLEAISAVPGFAVVLTDGTRHVVVRDRAGILAAASTRADEPAELGGLDVTVLHRGLIVGGLGLRDTVEEVGYAHDVDEALTNAQRTAGTAVLLRPTPVAAVAAVAAAGGRMPRKSTLFTPKPASGLVMRRFADEN